jgi:CheY-like chemotaxis protein
VTAGGVADVDFAYGDHKSGPQTVGYAAITATFCGPDFLRWRLARRLIIGDAGSSEEMSNTPLCLRVLVVDDEPLIRWAVAEALSAGGHTAVGAHTAAEARLGVTTGLEPFDVILLDYRLTDSEDLRLLADLRRTSPASAIIFMTAGGYATAAVVDAARALGACRALTKPVDVETIGNVVLAAHHERRGGTRWPMPLDAEVVHAQPVDPSTT